MRREKGGKEYRDGDGGILWKYPVVIFRGKGLYLSKDKVWKMGVENYGCDDPGITYYYQS